MEIRAIILGNIWIYAVGIILIVYQYRERLRIRAIIWAICEPASVGKLILSAIVGNISKNTRHCGIVLCRYQRDNDLYVFYRLMVKTYHGRLG